MTIHMQLLRSVIFAATLAVAGSAFAQTPTCAAPGCNSVTSDGYNNTASGTSALQDVDGGAGGVNNAAFGDAALGSNTTGYDNTASGSYALASNTSGIVNTANGNIALFSNTTGSYNTASGMEALYSNTTGSDNTASGFAALFYNTTGSDNTASGWYAVGSNTTGSDNTGSGSGALASNTTGTENTANGYQALYLNSTGNRNNASGEGALYSNTTASDNNATGASALHNNTTGALNNAVGNFAMEYNTTGNNNNAVGYGAMLHNTTGSDNSAQGYESLGSNTTGNLNIAIGYKAGFSQTSGSQNIYLGNTGVAAESHVIRIGSSSGVSIQNAAFIAGISGNVQTGGTVVVTASGQLGVASSSRRYKQDIEPLGDVSERLLSLRPVRFRYIKPDEQGEMPVQFGLIAEEVADVLPEVVYRNAEGKVEGVRYDELTPMLLSLAQQQQKQIAAQAAQLTKVSELERQVAELKGLVASLALHAKDERVAMR
jgi:trimeric autotransporter adhesin